MENGWTFERYYPGDSAAVTKHYPLEVTRLRHWFRVTFSLTIPLKGHKLAELPGLEIRDTPIFHWNIWDGRPHLELLIGGNMKMNYPHPHPTPKNNRLAAWLFLCLSMKMPEATPAKTNSSYLKIDPWKRRFLLETIIFRGGLLASGWVVSS